MGRGQGCSLPPYKAGAGPHLRGLHDIYSVGLRVTSARPTGAGLPRLASPPLPPDLPASSQKSDRKRTSNSRSRERGGRREPALSPPPRQRHLFLFSPALLYHQLHSKPPDAIMSLPSLLRRLAGRQTPSKGTGSQLCGLWHTAL